MNVQLRQLDVSELSKGEREGDLSCIAITERSLDVRQEVLFLAMDRKVIPQLGSLIDEVSSELDACIVSMIFSIRWVRG
jgi:hypothetical protein